MHSFRQRAAIRIGVVCLLLAGLVTPLAWFHAKEQAEDSIVALASEESRQLLLHFNALDLTSPDATSHAKVAAETIAGGLFDIAEVYDAHGNKLAEASSPVGLRIESLLPSHVKPVYRVASYESLHLDDTHWLLRVFVPLLSKEQKGQSVNGYFEGVRLIPQWQQDSIRSTAFDSALLACLAALLCGITIYPIVVRLSMENERKTCEVLDSHISMMEALGRAIAKRDSDTGAHNYRVAWMAAKIGSALGVKGPEMQSLIAGSFLHDVGKIGIPDAILLKPGRLLENEMAIMRTHVTMGEEIVTGMGWLDGAREVVAGHHEKWDGTGYPRGRRAEEIPLAARIFAVADVFDALSSRRPYKEPIPFEQVMEILRKDSGCHFDPTVVNVFERMALDIHEALQDADEGAVRQLLSQQIHYHFAGQ